MQPIARALHTKREQRINPRRAAFFQQMRRVVQEWLSEQEACVRTNSGNIGHCTFGQARNIFDPDLGEQALKLVLDNIW